MLADKRKLIGALALMLLLVFALAMRLQQWNRLGVPDEAALLNITLHIYDNPFSNGSYPGYPPLFFISISCWLFICQKILLFFGVINFPSQFVYSDLGYDFVFKAGRIVTALAGTALVALTWRMGREFFGRAAACGVAVPRFKLPKGPTIAAAFILEKVFALAKKESFLNRGKLSFFLDPKAMLSDRAKDELGFAPVIDFRTGVARAVG